MQGRTNRRAFLGAAVALPALALSIGSVAATEARAAEDAEIFRLWEQAKAAIRESYSFDTSGMSGEEEDRQLDAINAVRDKAEIAIRDATPVTIDGVIVQLWVAFLGCNPEQWTEQAVGNDDTALIFSSFRHLDFDEQMVVRAIQSLQAIGRV